MRRLGYLLLIAYVLLSGTFALAAGYLWTSQGPSGLNLLHGPADAAGVAFKAAIFFLNWMLVGSLLLVSQFPEFAKRHAIFLGVFFLLAFSYLNFVRDPHKVESGDFRAYYLAAVDIGRGQPIDQQPGRLYLYPPLLATSLAPFVSLGLGTLTTIFRLLNYLATLALMVLLYLACQRLRLSREIAALAVLVLLSANAPMSHNFVFNQINVIVEGLVLLSLLLFPGRKLMSAFALALAVHLKVYPLLLCLPFFYKKEWRWLAWFLVSLATVVVGTSLLTGPDYYWQFLTQVANIQETGIRNSSIDSLIYNTLRFVGLETVGWAPVPALLLRVLLLGAGLAATHRFLQQNALQSKEKPEESIAWGFALLPVVMLVASPTVWPHHFTYLLLTVPGLAFVLRRPQEWCMFVLAHAFIFWMPVNEIYPFSYLRLVGLLLLIALTFAVADRVGGQRPLWLEQLQERLKWTT